MPTLNIVEFSQLATAGGGGGCEHTPVPSLSLENTVVQPPLPIEAANHQSQAFADTTRIVRLECDADCILSYGEDPDATGSLFKLSANTVEVFGVSAGKKIAVVAP